MYDHPQFGERSRRIYHDSLGAFPWPVVGGYEDVHERMDRGLDVHAAWQLRDVWEATIKFLATVAAADRISAASATDDQIASIVATLLKPQGLSLGDWVAVLRAAAHDPPAGLLLPELAELVTRRRDNLMQYLVNQGGVVAWRNRRFGHGVLRSGAAVFAAEAIHWLSKLHDLFDLCASLFQRITLESDLPDGQVVTWGAVAPIANYHRHTADGDRPQAVRLRIASQPNAIELAPLLSVQRCGFCNEWAAFFMDRYEPGKNRAWFFDFVTGHTHRGAHPKLRDLASRRSLESATASGVPPDRREPDPSLFRDYQSEFEPPAYLAQKIAAFMTAKDRGVVVVTGPAGTGKTWLSQGLDHHEMLPKALGRTVPVLHVSLHGQSGTAAAVVASLAEQARREKRWIVPGGDAAPTPEGFAGWLYDLRTRNNHGELVVALDGWDELREPEEPKAANPLSPPPPPAPDLLGPGDGLPPGVFLVLTTRSEVRPCVAKALSRVKTSVAHCLECGLEPDSRDLESVIMAYARRQLARPRLDGQPLPSAWTEFVVRRAEGRFLYVAHYCRALHFGVFAGVQQLPDPRDYYPAFFAYLRKCVGDELFDTYYRRTLLLIAAAGDAGINIPRLVENGLETGRLVVVLDDLADMLEARRPPEHSDTFFRLGHADIRDYLTAAADWSREIEAARGDLILNILRDMASGWLDVNLDDPCERWVLTHFVKQDVLSGAVANGSIPGLPWEEACSIYMDAGFASNCLLLADRSPEVEVSGQMAACVTATQLLGAFLKGEEQDYNFANAGLRGYVEQDIVHADQDFQWRVHLGLLTLEQDALELRRLVGVRLIKATRQCVANGQHDQALRSLERCLQILDKGRQLALAPSHPRDCPMRESLRLNPAADISRIEDFAWDRWCDLALSMQKYSEVIKRADSKIAEAEASTFRPTDDRLNDGEHAHYEAAWNHAPLESSAVVRIALLQRFRAELTTGAFDKPALRIGRAGGHQKPSLQSGLDRLALSLEDWMACATRGATAELITRRLTLAEQAFRHLRECEADHELLRRCTELALAWQCALLGDLGQGSESWSLLIENWRYSGKLLRSIQQFMRMAPSDFCLAEHPTLPEYLKEPLEQFLGELEQFGIYDASFDPASLAALSTISMTEFALLRWLLVVAVEAHVLSLKG